MGESIGDLNAVTDGDVNRESVGNTQFAQGTSFDELHHHEGFAVGLAHLVDRADMRVIQRGCRTRFPEKPSTSCGVVCVSLVEHLQRHEADRGVDRRRDTRSRLSLRRAG